MKAAEFAARYLRQQGVRRVFGVPGLETLNLQEAFAREGIEFIATHHESAAAFMASVTGQLTGVPGVALATRGPGSANLFAGVAEAWLDRAPLLAISADTDPDRKPTTTHQGLDLMGIYRPVTKYCAEVTADNVAETLPRAFEATRRGLPGPSFLAFPNAEAGKQIPDSTMPVLVPEEHRHCPQPHGIPGPRSEHRHHGEQAQPGCPVHRRRPAQRPRRPRPTGARNDGAGSRRPPPPPRVRKTAGSSRPTPPGRSRRGRARGEGGRGFAARTARGRACPSPPNPPS